MSHCCTGTAFPAKKLSVDQLPLLLLLMVQSFKLKKKKIHCADFLPLPEEVTRLVLYFWLEG